MHKIQSKLLEILDKQDLSGLTLRKIGALVGEENQPQRIKHHLIQLSNNGLIKIDKLRKTIKKVVRGKINKSGLVSIPIIGAASCGVATIYADQNIEGYLNVSKQFLKKAKNIFAIKAVGLSMNKANIAGNSIEDGDYMIIDSENKAPDGIDYALCVIDEVANVKKYIVDKKNNQIILLSESTKDFPPIYIHPDDKFLINGVVIQVIKKPKF